MIRKLTKENREVSKHNRYIRYFLGSDGEKVGGLFTATGKLLKDLYNADDENYDDINYALGLLENEIIIPDLDYSNNKYNFAFNKSFAESKKIKNLLNDLNYYLNKVDYEVISEEFDINENDIIYEDDTQIAYKLHETLWAKSNKLLLEDPIDNLTPTVVAKYDENGCLILPSSWDDDSDDDWAWLWDE